MNQYFLFISLVFVLACKKSDAPTAGSQNQANYKQTISFNVGSKFYSLSSTDVGIIKVDAHLRTASKRFQLNATRDSIDLSISENNLTLNTLTPIAGNNVTSYAQWEDGNLLYAKTKKSHFQILITNSITTQQDFELVAGEFSGVLYDFQQKDSVIISNGLITLTPL